MVGVGGIRCIMGFMTRFCRSIVGVGRGWMMGRCLYRCTEHYMYKPYKLSARFAVYLGSGWFTWVRCLLLILLGRSSAQSHVLEIMTGRA